MEGETLATSAPIMIYAQSLSNRLAYITNILITPKVTLTNSKEEFLQYTDSKIIYSTEQLDNESMWIIPHGLLKEEEIKEQAIDCFEWEGLTVFFKTNGSIPFDIFAASFYLLTRYEEYLPHIKDELGRYSHTNSLAFNKNFLHQPVIQLWMKQIPLKYYSLFNTDETWTFIPTYDIDIAYSYTNHSFVRNVFGFFRDFIRGNRDAVAERLQVLGGAKKDPYDIYEWLDLLHSSLQLKPIYFFLVAANKKGLDKNIDPSSAAVKFLIKNHSKKYEIGIHPSIQSTTNKGILNNEIKQLKNLISKEVNASRNHYIKIEFPNTYRELIHAKINNDYSMGYPTINGFRASYAKPHHWFDLTKNKVTELVLHSFCYMDATAIFQERIAIDKASADLQYYFETVRKLGGEFITIFHNNFLTDQVAFKEWKDLYADFLLRNGTR